MIDVRESELLVPSVDAESDMDYSDAATVKFSPTIMAYGDVAVGARTTLRVSVTNFLVNAQ